MLRTPFWGLLGMVRSILLLQCPRSPFNLCKQFVILLFICYLRSGVGDRQMAPEGGRDVADFYASLLQQARTQKEEVNRKIKEDVREVKREAPPLPGLVEMITVDDDAPPTHCSLCNVQVDGGSAAL